MRRKDLHQLLPPGVSVRSAAETLGIAPAYLSRILCRVQRPGVTLARKIVEAFPSFSLKDLRPDVWA